MFDTYNPRIQFRLNDAQYFKLLETYGLYPDDKSLSVFVRRRFFEMLDEYEERLEEVSPAARRRDCRQTMILGLLSSLCAGRLNKNQMRTLRSTAKHFVEQDDDPNLITLLEMTGFLSDVKASKAGS